MIELIEGLPGNVVGIHVKQRVTKKDYEDVLVPAVRNTLKRHDKIRLYYEFACRFPGASWEDLRLATEQPAPWERVAVVTDIGWLRYSINALRFLIPGEIRVFASTQAMEGRAWITAHSLAEAQSAA